MMHYSREFNQIKMSDSKGAVKVVDSNDTAVPIQQQSPKQWKVIQSKQNIFKTDSTTINQPQAVIESRYRYKRKSNQSANLVAGKRPIMNSKEVELIDRINNFSIQSIVSRRGTHQQYTEEDTIQELQSDINTLGRPSTFIDNINLESRNVGAAD